jgi:chromate reductase
MRILGISGSLRDESLNTRLLRAAAELLPPGAELVVYDAAALKAIPAFDEDDEAAPTEVVQSLRETIRQADAILFATPEYNGSIPGQLKNALDWVSRPSATNALRGKPVAVVGASTGLFGAVWAQAELRKVLQTIGSKVVDRELPFMHAHERFDDDGRLADDDLRSELADHVAALVDTAESVESRIAA